MDNLGEAIHIKILEVYSSLFLCGHVPTCHGIPSLTLIRVITGRTQKFCCIVRKKSSLWSV